MEEEVRLILRYTLSEPEEAEDSIGFKTRIRKRLVELGVVELELPRRNEQHRVW